MDGELYKVILEDEFLETLVYFNKSVDEIIFKQDNDFKNMRDKAQL